MSSSVLRLDELSAPDAGVFSCQARTGRSVSSSLEHELTVMNATRILTPPQSFEVTTIIMCQPCVCLWKLFSCVEATQQVLMSVCQSVCLSVCLSVCVCMCVLVYSDCIISCQAQVQVPIPRPNRSQVLTLSQDQV